MSKANSQVKDVSIIVPLYNEAENVAALLDGIVAVFNTLPECRLECIFVNDGSTDGTRAALERLSAETDVLRALHLTRNCGQSAALIAGLQHARGEYLITMDGDLQNDPKDIPRFLELLETRDFICGYRKRRQDNVIRRISSRVANKVRDWALRDGLHDASCGMKGLRRTCLPHIISFNGVHRFMGAILLTAGATVEECLVTHHPRLHGESKYGVRNRLWRGLFDLVGVAWLRRRYVNPRLDADSTDHINESH